MDSTQFRRDHIRPWVPDLRPAPIIVMLAMMGAFRSIGQFPIYLGYLSALAGLIWIGASLQISKFLIPSYLLVLWGYLSLVYNGLGPYSYVQLTVVLGGIGLAEIAARMEPSKIAELVSRRLVWIILALTVIEFVLIELGMGQRTRELDGELVGGLFPDLGIAVPRFMGSMGGSGFSGCMTGALGLLCLVEGRKKTALTLFFVTVLMVSRGPLLALIIAFMFHFFRDLKIGRICAFILLAISALFPVLIWYLESVLSKTEIVFLIKVSTERFLHYMSFLEFGLSSPIFGIGYSNYESVYTDYFYTADFQQWGTRYNVGLIREAHNFMLDIFGEMGVVAWILAAVQLVMTGWRALSGDARYGAMFIYVTICFFFLSGLSNWVYWLMIGIIMSHSSQINRSRSGSLSMTVAPYRA
ncbi:O-antigen ligase family protein [Amaricoccus solimangrovi]|uniref:O-antigen ligase family protein n=1 Tax=Amaricoccus solimangrovi TaxID=2589815 RepID=A0A501WGV1_9RHOB|nr:O-antigen ligase family protein [Amaricoccus solimangrovi]TPE49123.1 O-antigen ligase family protein [Amaricoccus solimangrovi]